MKIFLIRLLIFGLFAARLAQSENLAGGDITGSIEQDSEVAKMKSDTSQAGLAPEFGFCYNLEKLHYWGATYIERDLQKANWPQSMSVSGTPVQQHEWIEIDLCARTMMAEIGTEPACGNPQDDAYQVALARVIANRSKEAYEKAKKLPMGDSINALLQPTKTAVEAKQQFSVWNRNAKVRSGTACPDRTGVNAANWQHMIYLCKFAVIEDGERMRMRTTEMTDDMKYYTSGCRMHYARLCEGYQKLEPSVDGMPINNYKCFELWKVGNRTKPAQEAGCIQHAKSCCTGPEMRVVQKALPGKNGKPGKPEVSRIVDTDSMLPSKMDSCEKAAPHWLDPPPTPGV